jgi:glycosyltransferase involved in cell wall biosynthesis
MPEPHVLLATDSVDPSGVGRHMMTLGQGLAATHRITLAFPEPAAGFAKEAEAAGLAAQTFSDPAELIESVGPDLLHVHAGIGWEGHVLARAGADARRAVVRTEHLPWLITDPAQEAEYADAAVAVDAFVAVSDAAASTWAPVLARLAPGALLAAIPNGVTTPVIVRSRAATRAALGVSANAPLLLCVGRFTPQKDQRTLVRAVRALEGVRLLLAGDGPERDACVAEAKGCERIAFLGRRNDVGDLMAAADLLVLPSRFEGLPLVLLEAMAVGLPIVATRIESALEALGPDHPWLAAPGDVAGLAGAIAAAIATPPDPIAAAGRRRYRRAYTAERMTSDTAALYRRVLQRTPVHEGPQT